MTGGGIRRDLLGALGYLRRRDFRGLAARLRPGHRPDAAPGAFPFAHEIDAPTDGDEAEHTTTLRGWVAVPAGIVERLAFDCGASVPIATEARLDIERLFPGQQVVGFDQSVAIPATADCSVWALDVVVDGASHRLPLPGRVTPERHREFLRKKRAKLERVRPLMRCPRPTGDAESPSCGGEVAASGEHELRCGTCGHTYEVTELGVSFLTDELADIGAVEATEHVSSWGYDDWAEEILARHVDGLVLDAGAGLKHAYRENVVHFEIVAYPSTDVLGIGERLPFADSSFDAVFSLSVLEHVRDPFRCAAEIARVLKPGGTLYANVPFLQPYHGYPHHYYNMTLQGLENVFRRDGLEIERSGTPIYGWPIFTLPWYLGTYRAGLPPDVAARFDEMRMKDLILPHGGRADVFLDDPFVTELSEAARTELASVNYVIAKKPVGG